MRNNSITEIRSLNDAIEQMRDELPLSILANSDVMSNKVADICYEIAVKEQKVKDLENHIDQELKFASGPLATSMDDVLHANKIPRQQYHGKSFVGNHVHKACKINIIDKLMTGMNSALKNDLEECPISSAKILNTALEKIKKKHTPVFETFAKVHTLINHTRPVNPTELREYESAITDFSREYRK
ncbi:uncharacterized protein LOC117122443, partial [Anneissia japonica]|uniref:uncharacterized protein LOC117122443 n=1 Tax=Anneissia japonica TaxID=1529436 RepID=UPI001425AFC1